MRTTLCASGDVSTISASWRNEVRLTLQRDATSSWRKQTTCSPMSVIAQFAVIAATFRTGAALAQL